MDMTQSLQEHIAVYREKYGKEPSETAILVFKRIAYFSTKIKELGHKNASEGKASLGLEAFYRAARMVFGLCDEQDEGLAQDIAGIWHMDYMEGYNSEDGVTARAG